MRDAKQAIVDKVRELVKITKTDRRDFTPKSIDVLERLIGAFPDKLNMPTVISEDVYGESDHIPLQSIELAWEGELEMTLVVYADCEICMSIWGNHQQKEFNDGDGPLTSMPSVAEGVRSVNLNEFVRQLASSHTRGNSPSHSFYA